MANERSSEAALAEVGHRVESSRYRAVIELAALDKSDFDGVLRRILTTDARELDLERVNCWTLEGRTIRCVAGYLRSSDTFEAGTVIEATNCPSYFRALADDPVILADDARTDARTREFTDSYLIPLGITSMMDVPIWVRGRLWGVVCHEHVGPARRWTVADRDFAISIGHIVSMAVEARERADVERIARFSEFFMGVLSHDLRNPLASIRAAAELLREGETDITRRNATNRIVRNSDLMARMIEQLLDFTRVRLGGGMPMKHGPADLAELARQIVSDLPANDASRVDVEGLGSSTGLFDIDRIWQAVSNLVGNALQHGVPNGRVRVVVDGNDAHEVIVKVTNAGVVPEEVLHIIFDPFQRHDARATDRNDGLGLGLFIVREIVTAHDGTITVASDAGEITFTMTLPRHPPRV
ncbi:MAG TPA: GAF domain-containing sensor histidine kinase [Kofleriaceae bacterium]